MGTAPDTTINSGFCVVRMLFPINFIFSTAFWAFGFFVSASVYVGGWKGSKVGRLFNTVGGTDWGLRLGVRGSWELVRAP